MPDKLSRRGFLKKSVSSAAGLGLCPVRCVSPVLAFCSGSGAGSAANVVLIVLDTVRADSLGCYGNREGITPAIDRFVQCGSVRELLFAGTVDATGICVDTYLAVPGPARCRGTRGQVQRAGRGSCECGGVV